MKTTRMVIAVLLLVGCEARANLSTKPSPKSEATQDNDENRRKYERAVCYPVDRMDIAKVDKTIAPMAITSSGTGYGYIIGSASSSTPTLTTGVSAIRETSVPRSAELRVKTDDVECRYNGYGDSPIKAAEAALVEYRRAHGAK